MTRVVTGQVGGCQRAGVPRDGPRLSVGTRPGRRGGHPSNGRTASGTCGGAGRVQACEGAGMIKRWK